MNNSLKPLLFGAGALVAFVLLLLLVLLIFGQVDAFVGCFNAADASAGKMPKCFTGGAIHPGESI